MRSCGTPRMAVHMRTCADAGRWLQDSPSICPWSHIDMELCKCTLKMDGALPKQQQQEKAPDEHAHHGQGAQQTGFRVAFGKVGPVQSELPRSIRIWHVNHVYIYIPETI